MTVWWGLLRKELREISRDRRALLSGLGLAFLAPMVIYFGIGFSIKQASDTPPVWVEVINPQAAPALVELLAEGRIYDIGTSERPGRPEAGKLEIGIAEGFRDDVAAGAPAEVILRGELNDDAVRPVYNRVRDIIRDFSSSMAGVRLIMRGVDPGILRPIDIVGQDTAPAGNNAGRMTMMIGIYVMMAAFVSAISSAVDTSAGERERLVLEVLLIQPVTPLAIVTAKLTGVFLVAMLGVLLTLTFSALAMSRVELEKVGLAFSLAPLNFVAILLAMMPLALLGGALNLLVGYASKTFKEAQAQVTMVIMIPALAPLVLMFTPDPPPVLRSIPVTGQFLYLESLFKSEAITPAGPLLASGSTLVLAVAIILIASRRLGSEKSVAAL